MSCYRCISTIRDKNGKVKEYIITDGGNKFSIDTKTLKNHILNKNLRIYNLKIDKAGRLIQTNKILDYCIIDDIMMNLILNYVSNYNIELQNKNLRFKVNVNVESIIKKANIIGTDKNIFIIADEAICIFNNDDMIICTNKKKFRINDCTNLFSFLNIKSIVFENVDTYYSFSMDKMFYNSTIEYLDISSLDKSNIVCMEQMFNNSTIKELKFGKIQLENLKRANFMFRNASIDSDIIIDKVDFKNLITAKEIFFGAYIKNITIKNCKLKELRSINQSFVLCITSKLEIIHNKFNKELSLIGILTSHRCNELKTDNKALKAEFNIDKIRIR